mgnify:CR=1 FL=1
MSTAEPTGPRRRHPAGAAVVSVIGELLLTLGAVVLLYVVWQLWWTNIEADSVQSKAVGEMTRSYDGPLEPALGEVPDATAVGEPVVMDEGPVGTEIGVVYIPRLGQDYSRPVIEGTTSQVLDTLGLGHYEGSAMPGEQGNFAVAGHRQTNGAVLDAIDTLREGDRIHVRTADGYYTYRYAQTRIVRPEDTAVIAPVPGEPEEPADGRYMTLTSCHPRYGDTERIVVHAELESWRPNSAGPPPEIARTVRHDAEGV